MTVEFYLDIGCSFLLKVFEHVSCCGKSKYKDSYDLDEHKQKKKEPNLKRRIVLIRITFGLIFNIAAFITVCVLNREIFMKGKIALGFFITIVSFTVISYIVIEVTVWIILYHGYGYKIRDEKFERLCCIICYRIYEIEFDALLYFYNLVLSNWEMNEFTTATTVLGCLDIIINIIILGRNCYDVIQLNSNDKWFVASFVLLGIMLSPLLSTVLLITLIYQAFKDKEYIKKIEDKEKDKNYKKDV